MLLSAAASIIGLETRKIIDINIASKFCFYCVSKYDNNHVCFKNNEGSSTGMESFLASKGVRNLEEKLDIHRNTLIADGDFNMH